MTRALVVYGTTYGGVEELAAGIGSALRARGLDAEVLPARRVAGVAPYDAVIVAGALRGGRWARDVRRLVRQRRDPLSRLPVWLVAAEADLPVAAAGRLAPVAQLAELAALVGARAAVTVGSPFADIAAAEPAAAGSEPDPVVSLADAVARAIPARVLRAVPAWGAGGRPTGGAAAARRRARLRLVRPEPQGLGADVASGGAAAASGGAGGGGGSVGSGRATSAGAGVGAAAGDHARVTG